MYKLEHFLDYIRLARLKGWIKNLLVFLPVFFSLKLRDMPSLARTAGAFLGFCLVSAAVYAANDAFDAAYDRMRDDKRDRPVAAGRITAAQAGAASAVFAAAGVSAMLFLAGAGSVACAGIYMAVNAAYTAGLKRVPVLDAGCIAAGFVLRVYAGAYACGAPVSEWLFLTVASASLFMGFGKRYGEMAFSEPRCWRESVRKYDPEFLKGAVFASAGLSVGFYALWAMQAGGPLVYSVPVLLLLLFRYLLDVFKGTGGGDPVRIFYGDRLLSAGIAGYGAVMAALLYF